MRRASFSASEKPYQHQHIFTISLTLASQGFVRMSVDIQIVFSYSFQGPHATHTHSLSSLTLQEKFSQIPKSPRGPLIQLAPQYSNSLLNISNMLIHDQL
jgi:hypothetical protein